MRNVSNESTQSEHCTARGRYRLPILALRACVALLCGLLFAASAAADTPAAANYAGGDGTEGNPFQISTLAELRKFMESSAAFPQHAYYKLTATIDATDTNTWLGFLGWLPVDATLMQGFDGQNFEIQNLTINRPNEDNVGFLQQFGVFCCQELKNVRIIGGHVTGRDAVGPLIANAGQTLAITNSHSTAAVNGRSKVGGLAGVLNTGSIAGSSAAGAVTGTSDFVGGLAGQALGTAISSSHATGHVIGKKATGGLIGTFALGPGSPLVLTSSWATGNVDGDDRVGGLVGESTGKVTFSFATGTVTATGIVQSIPGYAFVGGLIGIQDNRETQDSWASGSVSGPLQGVGGLIGANAGAVLRSATVAGQTVTGGGSRVGGLVGDNTGSITSSRSASTVTVNDAVVDSIGGLVGANGGGSGITTSYATGSVTAPNAAMVGGLVGWHTAGSINGSHAHGNVSGAGSVGGLIGLSTNLPIGTSHATGAVSGASFVGGLIGNRGSGSTDLTFATGTVSATGDDVGGLLGFNGGTLTRSSAKPGSVSGDVIGQNRVGGLVGRNQGSIQKSYAIRTVSGATFVGGLVGQGAGSGIQDSYAKGGVTGSDKVGGLVGRNETGDNIARCYASGTVTSIGAGSLGGLIGDNQASGNANNYWNSVTTALPGIAAGTTTNATGLTNVQMKQQASFVGFVFVPTPWRIDEGLTEPYLDWAATAVTTTGTTLVSGVNPSVLAQPVTFTATVAGTAPTGNVLFQDGASPLGGCLAVTLTAGQAQCTTSSLATGTHGIIAIYSGDTGNTGSQSSTLNQVVLPPTLDVDASISATKYDVLTDGLLTMRYLFGFTGSALVTNATGATATRTDPAAIKAYLDAMRPLLDIDGNGTADALTDGVLIIRYLSGLTGDALIAGAIDLPLATRKTAEEIESHIQSMLP